MSRFWSTILVAVTATAIPFSPNQSRSQPFSQESLSPWDAGAVTQFPIHSSCNVTQRRQLELALNETIELADHAKAHILRWGNESDIYQKYFGNRPPFEAIGAFDIVVNGEKGDVLFRCDNPDHNCDLEGWGGHWRGENGTDETVICDLSFETRRSLTTMCAFGYNVAEFETKVFWSSDLLHRLYHMPAFGQNTIDHYADGHAEVIEMAAGNKTYSTRDSETLQYFALEAYAYDISLPGEGCPGPQEEHGNESPTGTSDADATPSPSSSETPENCHTHDGGVLHCT
ncbi:hypothetical protein ASPWEDRAFT_166859 [Aspergillus wentii DTO 134E9]|uniref:Putative peptidase domain-containing protein n=1 Tax=Aspergillus wentii DTO 134E9 TaxID=1073089 RepID=A0A1L9S0Z7_ASPWE|nr:uncharacterized protein ASPWEDRAFT_166859 [Aspergillus wentii DTO 134E9]OJJ40798.1 hypothetical protein ASPWEDRAFT_166859 [Aspergillus wentii DTO 134E9]